MKNCAKWLHILINGHITLTLGFQTLLRLIFGEEYWHPTPVLLLGKSHGRRSLVGCSPWGRQESDTTGQLYFHFSLSCIGEGNGNPLQCSCLENPRDGGAWWAAVSGIGQSRTRLKRLSSSSSSRADTVSKTFLWVSSCILTTAYALGATVLHLLRSRLKQLNSIQELVSGCELENSDSSAHIFKHYEIQIGRDAKEQKSSYVI